MLRAIVMSIAENIVVTDRFVFRKRWFVRFFFHQGTMPQIGMRSHGVEGSVER